jgi:hypothetical protein
MPALSPASTKRFSAVQHDALPSGRAVVATSARSWREPASACANARVSSPLAMAGTSAARCFAEPASLSKPPLRTTGGEIGLEREHAPQRLHHEQGVDRSAAQAAVGFGERKAEQAHLRVP